MKNKLKQKLIDYKKKQFDRAYGELENSIELFEAKITEGIVKELCEVIDQLDEPQPTEQQISDWLDERGVVAVDRMDYEALTQDEPAKPVIPKFVADYIQEGKDLGCDLGTAMSVQIEILKGIKDYIKNNEESFARAWLDGYEVEEEKYIVELLYGVLAYHELNDYWDVFDTGQIEGNEEWVYQFTEQEIKEYDERFWPFAVKVEEMEE